MDTRYFSYAAFGKKEGFHFFDRSGFVTEQENIAYRFEMFLQIDLMKIKPPEKTGMMAVSRLKHGANRYFFFGLFYPGRDDFNRDGYYGGAIALCNHYMPDIQALTEMLEQLSLFARAHVQNEVPGPLHIHEPLLKYYDKDFPQPSKTRPGIIDFRPTRLKFIEMAFRGQLGDESPKVYFVEDVKTLNEIDPRDFQLLDYEELMMEQERILLARQKELKQNNFSLSEENSRLSESYRKLLKDTEHLKSETTKLQQSEQRQRQIIAERTKTIAELECTIEDLDKREEELCTKISDLAVKEIAIRDNIASYKDMLKDAKAAIATMKTQQETLGKEIARLEKTRAELQKKEQTLTERCRELEQKRNKLQQSGEPREPQSKGAAIPVPVEENCFEQ